MLPDFMVGDKVRIILSPMSCGKEFYNLAGKTATVTCVGIDDKSGQRVYYLDIDNGKHVWERDMLEAVHMQHSMFGVVPKDVEQDKVSVFRDITEEMADLYAKKNHDYGDSFGEGWKEHGILGSVIRLGDKYRRLRNLSREPAQVKDESIRDTLMDLANYAVMTLVEMRMDDEE